MTAHNDHATWVSLSNDEMALLRGYLEGARPLTEDEAAKLLAVLDNFEGPAAKDPDFREAAGALEFVRDGECEIDDHAVVSGSDEGAYVMAWVWVSNADAGIEEDDDDGN